MAGARAAVGRGTDWEVACQAALEGVAAAGEVVDLAFLFASASYDEVLPDLVKRVRETTGAGVLLGCTGQAIVSGAHEIEDEPAVSLLTLALPGAHLRRRRGRPRRVAVPTPRAPAPRAQAGTASTEGKASGCAAARRSDALARLDVGWRTSCSVVECPRPRGWLSRRA